MYNHNKAQQSKNRVHISWDILYYPPPGLRNMYIFSEETLMDMDELIT